MNLLSVGTGIFALVAPGTAALFNIFIWTTFGASLLLCTLVLYPLAAEAYTLFWLVAEINYSVLGKELQHIITNIQIFSGVLMLFVAAFSLLQYLINPEAGQEKNLKGFVTKIIVVLILLVSSGFIFNLLDDLQHAIIGVGSDHLVEKIITGNENFTKEGTIYETSLKEGKFISYSIFLSMYNNKNATIVKDNSYYTSGSLPLSIVVLDFIQGTVGSGTVGSLITLISHIFKGEFLITEYVTYTYPVVADTVGVFLIVMFVKFALDIGVRNLTLLFMRMIFPIMAISYLIPSKKDNYFIKYITYYLSVYVSYFVKVTVIYILFFIITWMLQQLLGTTTTDLFAGLGLENHGFIRTLLLIVFLVAIFMFYTKGIPAIAKKIFGVEMTGKNMFSQAAGLLGGAVGLAVGGALGAVKGAKAGGVGAALKGLASGAGKAASTGMNVGKSAASGKIVDAFKQGSSGLKATKAGINSSIADSKEVKAKDEAVKKADEADTKAKSLQSEAKQAREHANVYAANDDSSEAKLARMQADNAEKVANVAQTEATAAAEKARKYDKTYKSSSELASERKNVGVAAAVARENNAAENYLRASEQYDRAVASNNRQAIATAEQQLQTAKAELNSAVSDGQTLDSNFRTPVMRADEAVSSALKNSTYTSAEMQQLKQAVTVAKATNPNYVVAPQVEADAALAKYEKYYADYENAKAQFINAGSNVQASAAAATVLMGAVTSLEAARIDAQEKVATRVSLDTALGSYDAFGEKTAEKSYKEAEYKFKNYNGTNDSEKLRLQQEFISSKEKLLKAQNKKKKYNPDERLYADELGLEELSKLQDQNSLAKKLREKLGVKPQENDLPEDDEELSGPFE